MQSVTNRAFAIARFTTVPLVILLTLGILGGVIFMARQQLSRTIRDQMAQHYAELFAALVVNTQLQSDSTGLSENLPDQFFAILQASEQPQMEGVIGTRLFRGNGELVTAVPQQFPDKQLSTADFESLQSLEPLSRFHPAMRLSELVVLPDPETEQRTAPILEVLVPLHDQAKSRLLGIAQFLLAGEEIAATFATLDRNLTAQALMAFLAGGGIIALALALAFRRLEQVNRLLAARTSDLLQANQELTMVAKTSAIGAVTAHLIHGLRNPLSGLQSFVAKRNARDPERSDTEWQAAISTAQRMQSLVNRVVQVLQEQHCTAEYELSIDELVSLLEAKVRPSAQEAQVRWERSVSADATLANRDANLVLLVLENLVQNAIQATPAGKTVRLDIEARLDEIVCTVSDEGSGLPPTVQENLFTPCRSTKDGGSGIGLAISKQLANHLAARLELQRTSPHGSTFAFLLPARLFDQTALDHSAKVASPTHA